LSYAGSVERRELVVNIAHSKLTKNTAPAITKHAVDIAKPFLSFTIN